MYLQFYRMVARHPASWATFFVCSFAAAACFDGSKATGSRRRISGSGGADGGGASSAGAAGANPSGSGGAGASGAGGSAGAQATDASADRPSAQPAIMFEQDDPNLVPADYAYERVRMPVSANGVISLDIAADERVFILERPGKLSIWKPDGTIVSAGVIPVFNGNEDGALSISLDPNFMTNRWVYIFWSPMDTTGNRLSRFEIKGEQLDLASEKLLLQVPDERVVKWHVGGGTDFDRAGNLYLGLGDNTNPFESQGYSPIDEAPDRSLFDAQRTSGNSKDFRGKILRIKPTEDGKYTIPAGNLFTDGSGLPEIYVMGTRNPFRIAVDKTTGWLYWGEVGPDAGENGDALATRGPKGYDEFNQAKFAGFYGWPYCIATNIPYVKYDFVTKLSGAPFDCNAMVNNSPNNTGAKNLGAARPAWIAYSYGSAPYPAIGGTKGRTAMAGPTYHWQPGGSINKVPRKFDRSVFVLEFTRGWINEVRVDAEGKVLGVLPFLPSMQWNQPIQMRISPAGVMYVAQHGGDMGSTVYRVKYVGHTNQAPTTVASSDVDAGPVPLTVKFSSMATADLEKDPLTFQWDFQSDGTVDSTLPNPTFTYTRPGLYKVKLTVSDGQATGTAAIDIAAGNSRPVVTITSPPAGAFVGAGERVDYTVSVTDSEDGTTPNGISCNDVIAIPALGHDEHTHNGAPVRGCTGSFTAQTGIIATENSWQLLDVAYTDKATPPAPTLTGKKTALFHFKRIEAEHVERIGSSNDVKTESTRDPMGGDRNLAYINDGSWICWNEINFLNITSITYRVSSAGLGGRIELHRSSISGPLLATTDVPVTGGWQTWISINQPITDPGGTDRACFLFKRNPNDKVLFNVNFIDFNGAGVSRP